MGTDQRMEVIMCTDQGKCGKDQILFWVWIRERLCTDQRVGTDRGLGTD